MLQLGKYSMGTGDRFMHQGKAQLDAIMEGSKLGKEIIPVWNKSYREHSIVKTKPESLRAEADDAVKALNYDGAYFVDADHINGSIVDEFIDSHDFFTLDLAEFIGGSIDNSEIDSFVEKMRKFTGAILIDGLKSPLELSVDIISRTAQLYLPAIREAGKIYRYVSDKKGEGNFVTEVSIDETSNPQTPDELFIILAAISMEKIPLQTIAPKFSGEFCKGVDYIGDVDLFAREFEADLAVLDFAIKEFKLPYNLKLSVHSGSDKFSIYPIIHNAIEKYDTGLHIKTAGTTWLEELIGLAESGREGLLITKEIYAGAMKRYDELCKPYQSVIQIDPDNLPDPGKVKDWNGTEFANHLRHDQSCESYNINFRQLLHLSYKLAAEMGDRFYNALEENEETIAQNVTENILNRHILPVFYGRE